MEFLKSLIYARGSKYGIFLFSILLLFNSLDALANQEKKYFRKNQKNYDFEQAYFQNSVPYYDYDSLNGQLKTFFGLEHDQSKNSYFPDLSIISDSEALRAIYRSKLNDMIIGNSIKK
tara:strand:+ start:834 stop:1187 length:354 start_codon:yes stop_codon:yes gene_type:complete